MNVSDVRFAGSIPAIYDEYLVPWLFRPYAEDVAARLLDLQQGQLLEIAAGTGAVTSTLAKALPGARIVATDLNQAMLQVAAGRALGPRVTWQQADAQQLPFADASFDAVVCQFGVMFLPDKLIGYREVLRVLRPGGRFIFNVWDRLASNEASQVVADAVAGLFPDDPPRFFERTPFGYFDAALIRQQVEAAGFANVAVETVELVSRPASVEQVAVGICQGTPLRSEIESRNPAALAEATSAATRALTAHYGGSGPFDSRMSALVATARRA